MILTRFFKSKWPSNNTKSNDRDQDDHKLAAADLPRIACEEDDPALRQAALQRITDLTFLLQRSEQDPAVEVRTAAGIRYRELLAGTAPDSPSWEQRQAHITAALPSELLHHLAQQAKEAELRLAVVGYLDQEEILETIAVGNAVTKVQLAELDRITSQDCLERIARQTRNKNKRVYRTAQERLDKLHAEQEKIVGIERLCQSMEALAAEPDSHPKDTRFQTLEREWNRLTIAIEDSIGQRYQQARECILQRARQTVAQQQQQVERFDSLESLLERLQQTDEWSPQLAVTIRDSLAQFANDNQPPTTEAELQFDRLVQAVRERERVLQHDHERGERQRALIRQMTGLAESGNAFREATIERFCKQWKSLEHPESERLATILQQQFDSSLQNLQERLQARVEQNAAKVQQLHAEIDQLEQALGDGELQQAIELQE